MTEHKDFKTLIKEALALHLGVEPEDIEDDDSLANDLHMRASDLTDFLASLESREFNTSKVDLTEIDTVADLVEALDFGKGI